MLNTETKIKVIEVILVLLITAGFSFSCFRACSDKQETPNITLEICSKVCRPEKVLFYSSNVCVCSRSRK